MELEMAPCEWVLVLLIDNFVIIFCLLDRHFIQHVDTDEIGHFSVHHLPVQ